MEEFHGPLFIVGAPRSGTKLFRDLLNRHRIIGIPDEESQFFPEFMMRYGPNPKLETEAKRSAFIEKIERTNFCRLMGKKQRQLDRKKVMSVCQKGRMADIFEAVLRSYLPSEKACDPYLIWGDKTPFYAMHLTMLAALYPYARLIHIIRDPRDVACSSHHAWKKSFFRSAVDWRDAIRAVWAFRDDPNRSWPLIEVRYEDLIEDPEPVLTEVCRFCGIDFHSDMLTLERSAETWGKGKGVTTILKGNSRKFLQSGTPRDLRTVEEITYNELIAYGYKSIYTTGNRKEKILRLRWHQIIDGFQLMRIYISEKGFFEGVYYKLRQRFLRRSMNISNIRKKD